MMSSPPSTITLVLVPEMPLQDLQGLISTIIRQTTLVNFLSLQLSMSDLDKHDTLCCFLWTPLDWDYLERLWTNCDTPVFPKGHFVTLLSHLFSWVSPESQLFAEDRKCPGPMPCPSRHKPPSSDTATSFIHISRGKKHLGLPNLSSVPYNHSR